MVGPSSPPLTSRASPIRVDWVFTHAVASFGITLAPGKRAAGISGFWNRDLGADLDELVRVGVHVLASLVPDLELERLGILGLPAAAARRGMSVCRFPLPDGGVPPSPEALDVFLGHLSGNLEQGRNVVVHCRGGLGRAGLTAACMLLRQSSCLTPEEAIAVVRRRRSPRAVETRAQEQFVARYATWLEARSA